MKQHKDLVASIHNHFNIFRNVHDAHEGPVTREEQLKAAERFLNWHRRQVKVGELLLAKLTVALAEADHAEEAAAVPVQTTNDVVDGVGVGGS